MAARPRAMAKWVLPTPGGPSRSSASPLATQRQVASSRNLLLVERGLGGEVESVQIAQGREVGVASVAIVMRRSLQQPTFARSHQKGHRFAQAEARAWRTSSSRLLELIARWRSSAAGSASPAAPRQRGS